MNIIGFLNALCLGYLFWPVLEIIAIVFLFAIGLALIPLISAIYKGSIKIGEFRTAVQNKYRKPLIYAQNGLAAFVIAVFILALFV